MGAVTASTHETQRFLASVWACVQSSVGRRVVCGLSKHVTSLEGYSLVDGTNQEAQVANCDLHNIFDALAAVQRQVTAFGSGVVSVSTVKESPLSDLARSSCRTCQANRQEPPGGVHPAALGSCAHKPQPVRHLRPPRHRTSVRRSAPFSMQTDANRHNTMTTLRHHSGHPAQKLGTIAGTI